MKLWANIESEKFNFDAMVTELGFVFLISQFMRRSYKKLVF